MSKQEKENISKELDKLDTKITGGEKKSDLVFDPRFHLRCPQGHVYTIEVGYCGACKYGKHMNLD